MIRSGFVPPSGTITHKREQFIRACENFSAALGVRILTAPNVLAQHYYSAGTPQQRLDDFNYLLEQDEVKGIIFSAGRDTAIDLVPLLPYDEIRRRPKIMAGISDATTLLSSITAATGLVTFLGLELLDFADRPMPYTLASSEAAWFSGHMGAVRANPQWQDLRHSEHRYGCWKTTRPGTAEGRLICGNFRSFVQLFDTERELRLPGAILCLETYKLPKKEIHKGLMQLKLRGILDSITGMIIRYCCGCDDAACAAMSNRLPTACVRQRPGILCRSYKWERSATGLKIACSRWGRGRGWMLTA